MTCEALINNNDNFHQRMGCNNNSISVTFADNKSDITVRKYGFFDNFRKNSLKEKKSKENSWTNIFGKKSMNNNQEEKKKQEKDEDMAKLIEQLELEGRTEAEISMHLSYIQDDIHEVPCSSSPKEKFSHSPTILTWFKEMQQSIKEEFGFAKPMPDMFYYPPPMAFESDLQALTVNISSAPFYAAPPPDLDLSYEELSSLEPVYVGSKCINLLPLSLHDGSPLPGDQTNCSVCLCEFSKGEELKSLPCVHFFHSECIDRWLLVGHTCPVCKRLVE